VALRSLASDFVGGGILAIISVALVLALQYGLHVKFGPWSGGDDDGAVGLAIGFGFGILGSFKDARR